MIEEKIIEEFLKRNPKIKIMEEFLKLNPNVNARELLWRMDGRLEWVCEHGVGHTVYEPSGKGFIHGCDGCCDKVEIYCQEKEYKG